MRRSAPPFLLLSFFPHLEGVKERKKEAYPSHCVVQFDSFVPSSILLLPITQSVPHLLP